MLLVNRKLSATSDSDEHIQPSDFEFISRLDGEPLFCCLSGCSGVDSLFHGFGTWYTGVDDASPLASQCGIILDIPAHSNNVITCLGKLAVLASTIVNLL